MIVNSGVDVAISGLGHVLAAGLPSQGFLAAAWRNVAQFLDVHMDHVDRVRVFVSTHRRPGRPVQM